MNIIAGELGNFKIDKKILKSKPNVNSQTKSTIFEIKKFPS